MPITNIIPYIVLTLIDFVFQALIPLAFRV